MTGEGLYTSYRVEMICYVVVPPEGADDEGEKVTGEQGAWVLAYKQIVDDAPDELWIMEGGKDDDGTT